MLADWQALQEQLADMTEFYRQGRLDLWEAEGRHLQDLWQDWGRTWEDSLAGMAAAAEMRFDEIAGKAEAAGASVEQHFSQALQGVAQDLEYLEDRLTRTLGAAANLQGQGSSGSTPSSGSVSWVTDWLGGGWLDFLDWFHQGGIVKAHQGMVLEPEYLGGLPSLGEDERLVIAQTGEGILPRESMARLGRETFEALRRGEFDTLQAPATGSPTYNIALQVQALDADSLAGFNWERLVKRHILPALQRGRRGV